MKIEGEKRYGLLLAAKDSEYVKNLYGGYFNVFVDALGDEGERWDLFRVLCRALGGKVAKANTGWDIGVRQVKILKENFHFIGFPHQLDEIPPALSIIECHQDEVWEVPVGAQVIAFSDKTGVEMFRFGDYILGIQGHPEYNQGILINLIDRLLSNNSIEENFAENVKLQLLISEPDRKYWEKICKSFLKGRMV
ncbi:hypothetical protein M9H77_06677 [Catharanthus roseus]|uniref:Uncharacterized protein n=1 Tax=Catharanthus roseus TaxID=4058 RepID=A0ACC0BSS5_CATRO|nr:hypothetical protein M9H77_06677 [Catharanthus roseus]